ncbi:AI-2E family transporter [Tetragenococcus solitarius]|uniref:AI-2E family transporter n=1 Tax=Tetragenococcus solitarius TaxID=71453 RepID=A0ABP6KVI9_9ENTE|nr:AI-2E family transporter [Tetragenococcus solitarius]
MKQKSENRFIQFLGGKTSYYVLGLIILSAIAIFIVNKVSFVFTPLVTILMSVLPPFIFAVVIYYIFNPFVMWVEKKMSRTWAVSLIYFLAVVIIGVLGFFGIRSLVNEGQELAEQFPTILDNVQDDIRAFLSQLPFQGQIDTLISSTNDLAKDALSSIGDNWQDGVSGIGSVFSAVSTTAITLFVGPVVAFFLLKDKQKFAQSVLKIVPPNFRDDFEMLARKADSQLGAFLKGQLMSSAVLGVMYWVTFLLIGLNYATVMAFLVGVFSLVPYIGSVITFVPGLIIAFQQSLLEAVIFVVAWFVIQALHGNLVMPRVMGDKLQLHFLTILLVVLVMGDLMGFIGVLFGIPIYSLIKIAVQYLFSLFKQRYNRFFGDEKGNYEDPEM